MIFRKYTNQKFNFFFLSNPYITIFAIITLIIYVSGIFGKPLVLIFHFRSN